MHQPHAVLKKWIALMMGCILLLSALPFSALATSLASAPMTAGNTQNGMVRVRLSSLGNPSKLNLTVYGSYTINGKSSSTIKSGSTVTVNFNASSGKLTLTNGGVTQDMGTTFKLRRHATSGDNGIKIAQGRVPGNLYPGDFYFVVRGSAGAYSLYTIAYIYMEDYLYGVLPYEMGNSSGLEALKAQAVAARTYTMRAMSASSSSLYDVVDTTSDQVYSGTPAGNANCKAAVDATKGIVSKNGSSFTATYYTASNGGQTESVKNAWGSSTYSYLKVKDDPYDLANSASRKNSFTVNASGTQSNTVLGSLLNQKASAKFGSGATVTAVSAITPHSPKYSSPSKLYTKLDFSVSYYRNGSYGSGTLTFDIFNELESPLGMSINSGSNELWSVEKTSSGFTVYARRYGHGIGMSQRGAMYMAQLGYTYDQILAFYFEGCTRVQYTLTRSILSPVISGQDSYEQVFEEDPAELEGAKDGTARVSLSSASASVSLLASPNANASSLISIPHGATVQVYGQSGSYILSGYGSLCGYLPISALSITGSIPSSTGKSPTVLYGYGTVVNSRALNLRSDANMNCTVYTTIPGGHVLPVFSITGNWAYVQYGLKTGYVSLDYIALSKNNVSVTPTQQPGASTGMTARVNTAKGSLNLRAAASDTAKVLRTIPQYETIAILEKGSTWCKTTYGGYTGYVMTKYLLFLSTGATQAPVIVTPAPTQAPSSGNNALYARVTTAQGSLNLRAMAADNARVLRTIPQYEVIQILEKGATWCKTTYGGYTGFVMTKFLTFLSSAATQAPSIITPAPTQIPSSGNTTLYARVNTAQGSLNLRYAAKSSANVLTTIPQYEYIPILEKGALWCKTTYGGHTGYVMTSFLSFVSLPSSSVPTQAPAATPAPTMAPAGTASYARVTTAKGSLNLRAKAQSYAQVLTTIPQYDLVQVLEKGASWCKVIYNGQTGYVMSQYLTFLSSAVPTATPIPTKAPSYSGSSTARVNTAQGSLNLRENAWDNAPVIGTIPQWELVVVLEYGTPFCHVLYNGQSGYVKTEYLAFGSVSVPTATPKPTQTPVFTGMTATVATQKGSLNLRESAHENAKVLTTIPQYTEIAVLSKGYEWTKVSYNGYSGYVMSKYLTFLFNSTNNSMGGDAARDYSLRALDTPVTGRIITQPGTVVNLRVGCSISATVILQMQPYDYVVITSVGESWCAVQYEGKNGFCMREYLEFDLNE